MGLFDDITEDDLRRWDKHLALRKRREGRPLEYWQKLGNFLVARLRRPNIPKEWRGLLLRCDWELRGYPGVGKLGPDFREALCDAMLIQVRALVKERLPHEENPSLWWPIRSYAGLAGQRRISEVIDLVDDCYHPGNRFVTLEAMAYPFRSAPPEDHPAVVKISSMAGTLAEISLSDEWLEQGGREERPCRGNLRQNALALAILTNNPKVPDLLALVEKSRMGRFEAAHVGEKLYLPVRDKRRDLLPIYEQLNEIAARLGWPDAHAQREQRRKQGMYGKHAAEDNG